MKRILFGLLLLLPWSGWGAQTNITGLVESSSLATNDVVPIVDVDDTSEAATGTTKKFTLLLHRLWLEALQLWQGTNAHLTDLADGELSGSKVGTGINGDNVTSGTVADARIASTLTRDSEAAAAYQPLDPDLTRIAAIGVAQGDLLLSVVAGWTNLPKGTDGQVLKMSGTNPVWGADNTGSGFDTNADYGVAGDWTFDGAVNMGDVTADSLTTPLLIISTNRLSFASANVTVDSQSNMVAVASGTSTNFLAGDGTHKQVTTNMIPGLVGDMANKLVSGANIGAATATTPSANDNDTSVATTAYVQAEEAALLAARLYQETNATLTTIAAAGVVGSGTVIRSNAVPSLAVTNLHILGSTVATGTVTSSNYWWQTSATPRIVLYESDAGADAKRWDILVDGAALNFRLYTDAGSGAFDPLSIWRTANTSAVMNFNLGIQRVLTTLAPATGTNFTIDFTLPSQVIIATNNVHLLNFINFPATGYVRSTELKVIPSGGTRAFTARAGASGTNIWKSQLLESSFLITNSLDVVITAQLIANVTTNISIQGSTGNP